MKIFLPKTKKTGTTVTFLPDAEIFEKTRFHASSIKSRLHETAYLNPGLEIVFTNRREGEAEQTVFLESEGICAYVKELNKGKTAVHDVIYYKGKSEEIEIEESLESRLKVICDCCNTIPIIIYIILMI